MSDIEIAWPPREEAAGLERLESPALEIDALPPTEAGTEDKWAGIVRLGGVGDNLIAASVLPLLKRAGYKVEVIAQKPYHVIFKHNPYIDKLSVKDGVADLPQGDMLAWQNWFVTRGREYELFVNLSHSCEGLVALFPAMSAFYWPIEFRRKLCDRNYLEVVHDIVGVPHEFGRLYFSSAAETEQALKTKSEIARAYGDGRVIGWCLSGTRIDKVYPYAPMAIARIIKEMGLPVVMMGAPGKDFTMAKAIMEHVERQNGSLDGLHLALSPDPEKPSWPIRRILSFANACDLVITPDTGPAWSVAFEAMPKIVLLSHASVENIVKHWSNTIALHADPKRVPCVACHRLHDTPATCVPNKEGNGAACISDISVELLLTATKAALGCSLSEGLMLKNWGSSVTLQGFPAPANMSVSGK